MSGFTPGPWKVWDGGVVVLDDAVEGNVICLEPEARMKASLESWPANAALIAAAPDLYAALTALVEAYGSFKGVPFDLPGDHPIIAARKALSSASPTIEGVGR